jgi:type IV pilus assembly protein PilN
MRISLNLATKPFTDIGPTLKRLRIAMGALAIAAIALGAGVYELDQKAQAVRAREEALDARITRVNNERRGYEAMMREPANAAVLAQAENLNQLFDEKAFSWTLAMEDLETVLPGGVQVTTLEPVREKDGHISVHLRVLGARDKAIELVENLEHSKRFLSPRIVNESAETSGGPNQRMEPVSMSNRVNFDLQADYNPAAPGERRPVKTPGADHGNAPMQPGTLSAKPAGTYRPPYMGAPRPQAPPQPRTGGPQ